MRKYLLPILLIGFWSCEKNVAEPFCNSSLTDELKAFADENWTLDMMCLNILYRYYSYCYACI